MTNLHYEEMQLRRFCEKMDEYYVRSKQVVVELNELAISCEVTEVL